MAYCAQCEGCPFMIYSSICFPRIRGTEPRSLAIVPQTIDGVHVAVPRNEATVNRYQARKSPESVVLQLEDEAIIFEYALQASELKTSVLGLCLCSELWTMTHA